MAWQSPYSVDPSYRDEAWAERERARSAEYKQRLDAAFKQAARAVLVRAAPVTLSAARAALDAGIASGEVRPYRVGGDVWLARLCASFGIALPEPKRTAGGFRITKRDEAMLDQFGEVLYQDSRVSPAPLADIYAFFCRWARSNGYADRLAFVGPRKLSAWLQREGWQCARHGIGMVFPKMAWRTL